MADGMGAGDLFRSRILGMGLEDTPNNPATGGMMSGMQPEQLQAFFNSPQVQEQFKQFGIDPQAILHGVRQSPFFSNAFMQGHPHLGGALSGAMANVAATPEAPLVSGAGSGMSRAMQGIMGGSELQRQYQLKQMMGPMGAMAGMMPTYGEQRRRAIEEAIVNSEQERQKYMPEQHQIQGDLADIKRMQAEAAQTRAQAALEAEQSGRPYYDKDAGQWIVKHPAMPAVPQGKPMPQDKTQSGPGMAGVSGTEGLVSPMAPGTPAQPAQPAGWGVGVVDDTGRISSVAQAKETPAQKAQREGAANRSNALAAESRYKGTPEYKIAQELGKADAHFDSIREKIDGRYNPLITSVGADSQQGKQFELQRQNELAASIENYLVRLQHNNIQITPEQQKWLQQRQSGAGKLPPQVDPNAKTDQPKASPGSAQAGGAGAQTSQGTAVQQPNPQSVW